MRGIKVGVLASQERQEGNQGYELLFPLASTALWGDAFALSAFVLPLLCLASGAFYCTLGRLPHNAPWNIVLATGAMTAIACCSVGGLLLILAGYFGKRKRLLWQDAFGTGISASSNLALLTMPLR